MLRCPFCDAELGGGSARLRGGRCPQCSSILNWADDAASEAAPSADLAAAAQRAKAAPERDNDDAMSIKDIVHTLVSRGSASSSPSGSPFSGSEAYGAGGGFPSGQRASPPNVGKTVHTGGGPPPQVGGAPAAELDRMWSKSLTSIEGKPSMTIKASSNEPDEAITDLFIRPFRIGPPGEFSAGSEFELQEVIGEGGVGVVYAARQASIDRTVAIKMLRDEFAHKRDHRNKFLSEAVVTGELDHPNIVPIYDLGTSELGSLFYAMKRVRGTPWSEIIRQQSLAENLRILMSVADAIAFAHSRGVIHRDLKPENVMLGDFGEVLVMDWGIALSTNMFVKSDKIGQSTSMGGTPAYMAPEMATGPLTAIGQASDVYLLGAMLYEIITGRTPHTGHDVMSCLYAAARNEIQPTEKSGELLEVAYRAMATRPADRYASVQDFQAAIREYQSHSESIVLSTRADEELAEARRTKEYQDYSRALFGFQEARTLWSGNDRAKTGEVEARLAYAERALEKGDFDLGLSLLDVRQPGQVNLHRKLSAARREREARQARIQGLRRLAMGLAALIMLTLTIGLLFISGQYRTIAERNSTLKLTIDDLNLTQKRLANEKANAETIAGELRITSGNLVSSNKDLAATRQAALNEARIARQEEQNAAAASYRAQIGVAAERIANNSFLDAERLLDDYQGTAARWSYFRHWEWGHLKFLCGRAAGQSDAGARIESLARSADGRRFAAGTATGRILVWEIDWPTRSFKQVASLSHNGPILAVALSASGDRLAAAGDGDRGAILLFRREAGGAGYDAAAKTVLRGHTLGVLSLAFSGDGSRLLSSSRDATARLWDTHSAQTIQSLPGHSGTVWSAAFLPGDASVVTGGNDGTVRLWRIGESEPRIYRGHEGPVYAVACSPTGNWIASAGRDRDVHIWSADQSLSIDYAGIRRDVLLERQGKLVQQPRQAFHAPRYRLTGHTGEVRSLAFSDEGTKLLSGGNDNTVKLWTFQADPASANFVTTFRGHGGWVHSCLLAADPRYAVSGSLDGFVKIWDADEYEEVRTLRGHEDAVLWAGFSANGQRMVTAGRDHKALLWSLTEREPLKVFDEGEPVAAPADGVNPAARLKEGHEFLVSSAMFFPNGQHIATSAGDGTVRVWDRRTGGQIRRLQHTGTLSVLALSAGGQWIVTGSDTGGPGQQQGALLWSAADAASPPIPLTAHPGEVSAAAFSHDPEGPELRIATGDVLGHVRLWRQQAGGGWQSTAIKGHAARYPITAVKFTPDGRRLLTASQDRSVLVHDALTGQARPLSLRHKGGVKGLDVSQDSQRALTLSSPSKGVYRVSLWDLTSGEETLTEVSLPDEPITTAVFGPKQATAVLASASSSRNVSRFWQWPLGGGEIQPLWPQHQLLGTIWSVAFAPDGGHVLAAGGSQARLLTAGDGRLERKFSPHGAVTSADFSPDGSLLATCSSDGDVKLWHADPQHAQYGRVAVKLVQPHTVGGQWYAVNSVSFSPIVADGAYQFVTAGNDGTARLWRYSNGATAAEGAPLAHGGRVRSAVFSPDGTQLLTAADDNKARLWRVPNGGGEPIVLEHPQAVLFAAYSPDGTRVITGCDDNLAYVFDLVTIYDLLGRAQPDRAAALKLQGHTAAVTSAAISPDCLRAITGSQDGMAKLWDLETGKEVLSLKRHGAELTSVHFSPDGGSILTSSLDGLALVWPGIAIGPSIKLSAARREIPRIAGLHAIDDQARIIDPDAGDLAGGALSVWPASAQSPAPLEVLVGGEIELASDSTVWLADVSGRRSVAQLERPAEIPGGVRLRLMPGCMAADAQRLLRAVAIRTAPALVGEVMFRVQITDAAGRASYIAETTLESAELPPGDLTALGR